MPAVKQNVPEYTDLFKTYLEQVSAFCDADGVHPQPMLSLDTEGGLTMTAVDGGAGLVMRRAEALLAGGASELVLGTDCLSRPGQGLEFDDFVSVIWYVGGEFFTAVIDYVPAELEEDQTIRAPNWDNVYWNDIMQGGPVVALRKSLGST